MRFFYEQNISEDVMQLSTETAKHVTQVLRMKTADQLLLTNGQGTKATAEIQEIGKRNCVVKIVAREEIANPNPNIALAIAFTKNNARIEWLLEKITEIGVSEIYPIVTVRSEKSNIKTARFQKKMVSAILQSQQYYLPTLHEPIAFEELIKKEFDNKLIAHCEDEISKAEIPNLFSARAGFKFSNGIILIGPEGDFTSGEIKQALQQNFKSISLGKNRLRTETAGLVAVTLLHHLCEK